MALDTSSVIAQINHVLAQTSLRSPHGYDDFSDLPQERISEAVTLLTAAIHRLGPPDSTYIKNAKLFERYLVSNAGTALLPLRGILSALKSDFENDYLRSVEELIHADVFTDFLDMGAHLLDQGYKDAAAVICGSVLEEHLRKLSTKAGLPGLLASGVPKKADLLNSELASAVVYTKLDMKNITAWLDLRNKAAHGRYSEYSKDHVQLMIAGVRNFFASHPA
jgi:hypothetical protein